VNGASKGPLQATGVFGIDALWGTLCMYFGAHHKLIHRLRF
jgi:hypothetical protein